MYNSRTYLVCVDTNLSDETTMHGWQPDKMDSYTRQILSALKYSK